MTLVMMYGGHRDGQILEVPGSATEPDSKVVRMTLKAKDTPIYNQMIAKEPSRESQVRYIDLEIIPRKATSGPMWKIDLPKELW